MAGGEQRRHGVAADETARAGDEDDGHGAGIVASTAWNTPSTAPLDGAPLRRLIEAMPKAELHLHLDGSLRVDTAIELARTRGIDAPRDWAGMSAALVAPMPCASQAELLRAFDLPIALMQDAEALERITGELVETKAADGVRYVEIRWGPLLHVSGGLSLADGIAAVCRGAQDAAHRTGIDGPADLARRFARTSPRPTWPSPRPRRGFRDQGLVGLGPRRPRGRRSRTRRVHAASFAAARDGRPADHPPRRRVGRRGAGAARARRWTPSGSRTARAPSTIRSCAPSSSPARVTLDLCPTSNWQAGIVPSVAGHPLARLDRVGVSGHPQHRRHDGVGHHPVRGVPEGGRRRSA